MKVPQPFATNKAIWGLALLKAVMALSFSNHAQRSLETAVLLKFQIPDNHQ